jgi:hypothetical protein
VPQEEFSPADHAIPVELGWTNTTMGRWDIRDQTELPPIGEGIDLDGVAFTRTSLPGTWNRWHRDDFRDRILLLRLRLDVGDEDAVRLMVHSTEHFRVWLDGDYLFGGQGTQYSFPTPHLTPAGQYQTPSGHARRRRAGLRGGDPAGHPVGAERLPSARRGLTYISVCLVLFGAIMKA